MYQMIFDASAVLEGLTQPILVLDYADGEVNVGALLDSAKTAWVENWASVSQPVYFNIYKSDGTHPALVVMTPKPLSVEDESVLLMLANTYWQDNEERIKQAILSDKS